MYERLLYLYNQNRLNDEQLEVAVSKGWISKEEKSSIIASKTTQQ